ncbi:unnamed protein product [Paramecium pentaurelia]|uniref:Myb-like domain-containing protein n=1 Tax=Paramecium pentaurelia TaxID=43138 RepID=A0A8S1Y9I4_9CILI|nr:unnamed protein product [Paramecium pentaurelia]
MQSTDILAVQSNFLQTHCMFAQQQVTEYTFEDVQEEIQIIESVETFNFEEDDVHNDYYNPIQKLPLRKPRKRRRRQVIHDKRRRKATTKRINRKHQPIPFNYLEDRQILLQVLELGPKFYKIAKNFPGRTLSMVKNRYYKTLRFQWDVILGQAYGHLNAQTGEIDNQQSVDYMEELNDENIYSQFLF